MSGAEGRSASLAWTALSLLGLGAWFGATVVAAVTNDDPSDPAPILRTFAVGGAVFVAAVLAAAGLGVRRRATRVSSALYRQLALGDVPPATLRDAVRGTQGTQATYLVLTGLTSALMFTAVGLGEDGPTALLLYAGVALVVVWLGVMVRSLGRAYRAADDVLAPLGLAVTAVPSWMPGLLGGPRALHGDLAIGGERHGRAVTIAHRPGAAVTVVRGRFARATMTSATSMAALTGQPGQLFRRVAAEVGPDGVAVRRSGNGAGRFVYHDLLLAERLAARAEAAT